MGGILGLREASIAKHFWCQGMPLNRLPGNYRATKDASDLFEGHLAGGTFARLQVVAIDPTIESQLRTCFVPAHVHPKIAV